MNELIYTQRQKWRYLSKFLFFALFILAPILDIFRFDLYQNHLVLFGQAWGIGFEDYLQGDISLNQLLFNLLFKAFLPVISVAVLLIAVAWRWGRLYCGWLCPHFSVVEIVNHLLRRSIGKFSIWDKKIMPERLPDGRIEKRSPWYGLLTAIAILGFAFIWAVVLLTYLLPPEVIYTNLWRGELTPNQTRFIAVATLIFTIEFSLARHLFCRFGCAVGLFQSLAWMSNDRAMEVHFDKSRAKECQDCNNACDHACPMRLKPRTLKRKMFTCTQCAECLVACEQVEIAKNKPSLLYWQDKY